MTKRPKIIIDLDRAPAMVVASTLFALANQIATPSLNSQQEMVVDALRRLVPALQDASLKEISEYLAPMSEAQLLGLTNAVKGVYHEMAFVAAENTDGDDISAELFGETNHPGADVILMQDGKVIDEIQLKAIQSISEFERHMDRYPEIEARVTEEVARMLDDKSLSSGFSNEALTEEVSGTLDDLASETGSDLAVETLGTSIAVSAALSARQLLVHKSLDKDEAKRILGDMGVGAGTALTIDAVIELI